LIPTAVTSCQAPVALPGAVELSRLPLPVVLS